MDENGQPAPQRAVITQEQLQELRDLWQRRVDLDLRIRDLSARMLDDLDRQADVEPGRFTPMVIKYQRGTRRIEQLIVR